jgi:hypothetical protein
MITLLTDKLTNYKSEKVSTLNESMAFSSGNYNINIGDGSNGNTVNILINSTQGHNFSNATSLSQQLTSRGTLSSSVFKDSKVPINIFENGIRKISIVLNKLGDVERSNEELFEFQQSKLNGNQSLDIKRFERTFKQIEF